MSHKVLALLPFLVAGAAACSPAGSGAAAQHLRECGIADAEVDRLVGSTSEEKAAEIAAIDCAELTAGLASGKGDGSLGWKGEGEACSWAWTCAGTLDCRAGVCTDSLYPDVKPTTPLGGACDFDLACADGVCATGICALPRYTTLHGKILLQPAPPYGRPSDARPYANVEVRFSRLNGTPSSERAFYTDTIIGGTDAAGEFTLDGAQLGHGIIRVAGQSFEQLVEQSPAQTLAPITILVK